MSMSEPRSIQRERLDFSKIKTVFPMPDLLAIQRQSYAEFLQMELLPEERKDTGLQAAFKDVFPISDFKETTQLDFISYSIGNWECKCGRLKGVENSRARCTACDTLLPADAELTDKLICPYCSAVRKIELPLCDHCGDAVGLKMKYTPNECLQKGYTFAVPLRLKVRLISWEKDATTKTKRLKHIKEQEVYFGDIALMTEKGTFIFNGIERVVVSPAAALAGRLLPPGRGQGLLHRQAHPVPRGLGRVRVRPQEQPLRAAGPQEEVPGHRLPAGPGLQLRRGHPQDLPPRPPGGPRGRQALLGPLRRPGRQDPVRGRQGPQDRGRPGQHPQEADPRDPADPARRRGGPGGRRPQGPGRGLRPVRDQGQGQGRGGDRRHGPRPAHRQGRAVRGLLPAGGRRRPAGGQHHQEGPAQGLRPGPGRDLPQAAPGRAPHHGERPHPVPQPLLQRPEVQLQPHRPAQVQHQAGPGDLARGEDPAAAGLRRGHQVPAQAAQGRGGRGRHRPSGQPPRPPGRRAGRERLPHRPDPHGADHQGEDDHHGRPGRGHAAGPDQLQAGHRRAQGVLRLLPAEPVHGPDQQPGRSDPQAAPERPGARRPEPGAGRVRGPRHPVQPLRAHLPDRDAGRPEHRPHLVPELLRPDQRLRLHRDPLPRGQGRPDHRLRQGAAPRRRRAQGRRGGREGRGRSAKSPRSSARGPSTCPSGSRIASTRPPGRTRSSTSPRPTPRSTRRAASPATWSRPARPATSSSCPPTRSTTSTSRPSSWSRCPRPWSPSWSTTTPTAP